MTSIQVRHNASTGPTSYSHFVVYMSGLPFSNYNTSLGPKVLLLDVLISIQVEQLAPQHLLHQV